VLQVNGAVVIVLAAENSLPMTSLSKLALAHVSRKVVEGIGLSPGAS
jgi:hypothetical protein